MPKVMKFCVTLWSFLCSVRDEIWPPVLNMTSQTRYTIIRL
jgi:hypothetical protein